MDVWQNVHVLPARQHATEFLQLVREERHFWREHSAEAGRSIVRPL